MPYLHEQCPPQLKKELQSLEEQHVAADPNTDWYKENALFVLAGLLDKNDISASIQLVRWIFNGHEEEERFYKKRPKKEARAKGKKLSNKRENGTSTHTRQVAHHFRQSAQQKRQAQEKGSKEK